MKPNPWLLPAVALVAVGGWLAKGKHSATSLQREISILNERIQLARTHSSEASAPLDAEAESGAGGDKKIHWKSIAARLNQSGGFGGLQDLRSNLRIQYLLMDMSGEELTAQLDEIDRLQIDPRVKDQFAYMILEVLADKDPRRLIERVGTAAAQQPVNLHIQRALAKWATNEPAAATAWLDQQIASGTLESKTLDGRSRERIGLESALVNALLNTDSTAAALRVAALPEEQRLEIFQQGHFVTLSEANQTSYAKVVRDTLPADSAAGILSNKACELSMHGNYEKVNGFISRIDATDDERKRIVTDVLLRRLAQGGTPITMQELEQARAWGSSHAPTIVDQATGQALASTLWMNDRFKPTSDLVLQLHAKSNNDDLLASFLKSDALRNRAAADAAKLIEHIKDPALRAEISALPQYANPATP